MRLIRRFNRFLIIAFGGVLVIMLIKNPFTHAKSVWGIVFTLLMALIAICAYEITSQLIIEKFDLHDFISSKAFEADEYEKINFTEDKK